MKLELAASAKQLQRGDHVAHLYDTRAEQRAVASAFLHDGLLRNERCVYVAAEGDAESVLDDLRETGGEVQEAVASGTLRFVDPRELYGVGARQPEGVVRVWSALLTAAVEEGFSGLRVLTDVPVELVERMGFDSFGGHEAGVNYFVCPGRPMIALCQYDRRRFPARITERVLETHPRLFVGSRLVENLYFRPLELVRGDAERAAAGRVEWMLRNLRARSIAPDPVHAAGEAAGNASEGNSPEWLAALAEHSSDALWIADDDGAVETGNVAAAALLGVAESQLSALELRRIVHAEDLPALGVAIEIARLHPGTPQRLQLRLRGERGGDRVVRAGVRAIGSPDGRLAFVWNAHDVTEMTDATRALIESQRLLRAAMDALPAHLVILDGNGRILAANSGWRRFLARCGASPDAGLPSVAYLDECLPIMVAGCDRAAEVERLVQALVAGETTEIVCEVTCRINGEQRWWIVRGRRFAGSDGTRLILSHDDVTERRRAEMTRDRFFELSVDAFAVMDRDACLREVNPAFRSALGYDDAGLLEIPATKLVHPEDLAGTLSAIERVFSGEIATFENRVRTHDGRWLWFAWAGARAPDEAAVYLVGRQVTEERRAREDTRRRAAQHAAVAALGQRALEGASLSELADQAAGSIAHALEVEYAAVGTIAPADRLVMIAGSGWAPGVVGAHTVPIGRTSPAGLAVKSGAPVVVRDLATDDRFELPDMLLQHGVRSAIATVVPGDSADAGSWGLIGGYTTEVRDFSAADVDFLQGLANVLAAAAGRERTEAALDSNRTRLAGIIDSAMDAIISVDENHRIVVFNRAAEQVFRCSAKDAVGQPVARFVPARFGAAHRTRMERYMEAGETSRSMAWPGQVTAVRADGVEFPVEATISRLSTAHGMLGTVVLRDVSERLRLEERLRQATKMEAIGRLAGGVAHDFNNLLVAITGYSELLLADLPPESPCRDDADEIRRAAERAAALTRQLLAFSRRQVLKAERINVNETLQGLDRLLGRVIGEDVELTLDREPTLWTVEADRGQFEQVILNLAVNARDAMPTGGKLTLRTRNVLLDGRHADEHLGATPGEYVAVSVTDTGCGIGDSDLPNIFEPFFTTKPSGKGTGLGLATVYGIITQSGGHVDVQTRIGAGTTFTVYLPRVHTEAVASDEQPDAMAPEAAPGQRETVLVVEDDEAARTAIVRMLERQGYSVVPVDGALAALETCAGPQLDHIAVVVSDVVMPDMGGIELARRLRAARPGLKMLLISGYADDSVDAEAIEAAGAHLLQKPFTSVKLAAHIRSLLDGSAGRDQPPALV